MFLFAIFIYPLTLLFFKKNINRKDSYNFIIGLLFSSIISLLFWSLSTLFNPYSMAFGYLFLYTVLKTFIPIFVLIGYIIYSEVKRSKRLPVSFISGYIYWVLCFSTALYSGDRSFYFGFINPLLYIIMFFIISFLYDINDVKRVYKYSIFISLPFFMIILSCFFIVNTLVFMILFMFLALTLFILFLKKDQFINEIKK